jgi:outer membrane protein TolC
LVVRALLHSEHVRAIREGPRIRETGILKAVAEFDPEVFFNTRWDDVSEPVGNTLTTGGPDRFNDHHWQARAGLRQKTWLGGSLEMSQELGLQDTNSLFFVPDQQAATRMTLSLNQPLLKYAGYEYNQSMSLLAEVQTNIALHELTAELQDHALDVIKAYWELYLQRALYLQRQRALHQADKILDELKSREQIDSLRSQIARARAAVAVRRAAVKRAELSTQTAQARIISLTNDPEWHSNLGLELLPTEAPAMSAQFSEVQTVFQTALNFRPEIAETMERVREAQVRLGISKNELLPTLDFVIEGYVAGLDGDYNVANSFRSQFTDGAPSYGAGFIFSMPLHNRAAQADYERRNREVAQVMHELNAVLSQVALDVEVATANVKAAYYEMEGRSEAMLATDEEVRYLHERWRLLPGEDRAVSFVLEELLDAQDRQMEAEAAYVRAQVEYTISHYRLQHAVGSLLHQTGTVAPQHAPEFELTPPLNPPSAPGPAPELIPQIPPPQPVPAEAVSHRSYVRPQVQNQPFNPLAPSMLRTAP